MKPKLKIEDSNKNITTFKYASDRRIELIETEKFILPKCIIDALTYLHKTDVQTRVIPGRMNKRKNPKTNNRTGSSSSSSISAEQRNINLRKLHERRLATVEFFDIKNIVRYHSALKQHRPLCRVDDMRSAFKQNMILPPVVVLRRKHGNLNRNYNHNHGYRIEDGHHRVTLSLYHGYTHIPVVFRTV